MKNPKDIWIDELMASATSVSRRKPDRDLFTDIVDRLDQPKAKTISIKLICLGAILFLVLNLVALLSIRRNNIDSEESIYADMETTTLLSDYNLYD